MNTLSIEISDSQREFLERQAAQEGLPSPGDYIQELIRAAQKRKAWALLEKEIEKGLESGEPILADDAYWDEKKARFLKKHPEAGHP